jgi:methionyl-tRNA formyltransferase
VLDLFYEKYESKNFKLIGLVSSKFFFAAYKKQMGSNVKFILNEERNTDLILQLIKETDANLLLSVQHNWILKREILQSVAGNAFNLHNAKLPDYKGFNSISHAIDNGDKIYISTLHWMDEKVDCGDILIEEYTPILDNDTAESLHKKTIEASVSALDQFFKYLTQERMLPRKKISNGEFGVFYDKNSLKKMLEINITDTAEKINRRIRAVYYPPYNNAYTIINGLKVDLIPREK